MGNGNENRIKIAGFSTLDVDFLPPPSYKFNVGDKVAVGNCSNAVVTDIISDGLAYEIEMDVTSRKSDALRERRLFPYSRVRPLPTTEEKRFGNEEIKLAFMGTTVGDLISYFESAGIDFDPPYQRDYCWSQEDKDLLLDSMFNNLDIGKFVLKEFPTVNDNGFGFEIVDGKQRLSTLLDFYYGKVKLKGIGYNDLSKTDRKAFRDYPVQLAKVRNINEQQILKLFVRLNVGKVMDSAHLEKVKAMIND